MKSKWLFHKPHAPWWRVWVLLALFFVCAAIILPDELLAGSAHVDSQVQGAPAKTIQESEGPDPFASLLTRRGPSAVRLSGGEPQLYRTVEGNESFLFQAHGDRAWIRFLCDEQDADSLECALLEGEQEEEVFILQPTRSLRGDVIYKDLRGNPVLRVTATGGATLFEPGYSSSMRNQADTLVPLGGKAVLPIASSEIKSDAAPLTYSELQTRLRRASEIISTMRGIDLTFTAMAPDSAGLDNLSQSILTTVKGIGVVTADDLGASILSARMETVRFIPSEAMSLSLDGKTLTVRYAPDRQNNGRPSSAYVAQFLENEL